MDIRASLIVIAVAGAAELILCRFILKPLIRFALPMILLVLSVSTFLYGKLAPLEGMQDLAYMVTGVLIFFGFVSSFAVAIIYTLITRKK